MKSTPEQNQSWARHFGFHLIERIEWGQVCTPFITSYNCVEVHLPTYLSSVIITTKMFNQADGVNKVDF